MLIFSRFAETELEAIGDYIAIDNPMRAVTFVRELRTYCAKISLSPHAFPMRDDLMPGLRVASHKTYLIFYRQVEDDVRIEHVLHGMRDYRGLF